MTTLPWNTMLIQAAAARGGAAWTGTGFVMNYPQAGAPGGSGVPLLITNRHVLAGAGYVRVHVARRDEHGQPGYGPACTVDADITPAFPVLFHPDPAVDLAALYAVPFINAAEDVGHPAGFTSLGPHNIIPDHALQHFSIFNDVLMIGFPDGISDQANALPIARRGSLAAPLLAQHQGQDDFVIDMAVFPGSSGSPVFLHSALGMVAQGKDGGEPFHFGGDTPPLLLGVLYKGYHRNEEGRLVPTLAPLGGPVFQVHQMVNIGVCVRARQLHAFAAMIPPYQAPPV